MNKPNKRQALDARTNQIYETAKAMVESEKAERIRKTALLRDLRLRKAQETADKT